MLTTIDNPFNPATQFNDWYNYDESKGYHTCSYLARIALVSEEVSELDEYLLTQQAIDEILKYNLTGLYTKVEIEDKD